MSNLDVTVNDGIALLVLSKPDKLNALDAAMLRDLADAVLSLDQDATVRAIILTGAGRAFCVGADISGDILDRVTTIEDRMRGGINRVVRVMRQSGLPIVTAVNGPAAGGGVGIGLAGDIVVAARSAYFALSFTKVGLSVDCGASVFVQRAIGAPRARALALLGDRISAEDAERWGLIWRMTADEHLLSEARIIARRLADGPPQALANVKQVIESAWNAGLADALETEIVVQAQMFQTEDLKEGVTAFLEKRKPEFRGV